MKILIIDDHAMIRSGVRQLCENRDAVVLEADNGKTALALAAAERPQLIVLDLNLPGISGLELLRQLLDIDPAARILVFSMHCEPVYAARALKIGAALEAGLAIVAMAIALDRLSRYEVTLWRQVSQILLARRCLGSTQTTTSASMIIVPSGQSPTNGKPHQ